MLQGPDRRSAEPKLERPGLRTPRSAAFAGIAFSVLLTISIVAILLAVPADPADTGKWLTDQPRHSLVLFAIALMPLAGTAFLWFVGVIRDRIGDAEDRFFATLFLGSGLLFIAMLLVAAATAAGLVASVESDSDLATSDAWTIGRSVSLALLQGGLQIVSVFTIATSTILLRTSTGRRWLAVTGYVISAMLLTLVPFFSWMALFLPAWVLAISLDILIAHSRRDLPLS